MGLRSAARLLRPTLLRTTAPLLQAQALLWLWLRSSALPAAGRLRLALAAFALGTAPGARMLVGPVGRSGWF
ncbi:hypothetical protein CHELA40_14845 [Chelatococcus asaccharovorans]|nr:hypothetical protein CHELA17_60777 [Chelatococcus asaccharovorans]CAH1680316.1 hypothetical protein CHELA40_14845 [Chelatococcus asaccharovorans]